MKALNRARIIAALFPLLAAPQLAAQTDTVRSALALKDSARVNDAIALLRPYAAAHPTNGDAARLLSTLLYWTHDIRGARAVADSSLALHPEDTALRLQYGTMLVEIGDAARATAVITPLLDSSQRGAALGLLGTLEYWRGDLTKARSLFTESLRADPNQPSVRGQLGSILETTAPWTSLETTVRHDDQPITSTTAAAEAGWFPNPLVRVAGRVEASVFARVDSITRELSSAELSISEYVPTAHLGVDLAAGAVQRSFGSSSDWRGRGAASLRLPSHLLFGVRAERAPYVYTISSLSTPVMTNTGTALLHLDSPRGWLGEASVATQRFPDDNSVNTAYVWMLAPLIHGPNAGLQLGYSAAWQDAAHSRFVIARRTQSVPMSSAQFDFSGQYVPYYTPQDLTAHSLLVAGNVGAGHAVTLRANGSYGLHATENTTSFYAGVPPSSLLSVIARRTFTPWSLGGAIDLANRSGVTLTSTGGVTHTAFYTAANVNVRVSYKFGAAARREALGL